MTTPAGRLLGDSRKRVSLMELDPPDDAASFDEEDPFAEPEEEDDENE
jgi:hypothetical protein